MLVSMLADERVFEEGDVEDIWWGSSVIWKWKSRKCQCDENMMINLEGKGKEIADKMNVKSWSLLQQFED